MAVYYTVLEGNEIVRFGKCKDITNTETIPLETGQRLEISDSKDLNGRKKSELFAMQKKQNTIVNRGGVLAKEGRRE